MNINFKTHPEPLLNQRKNAQPRPVEQTPSYFVCRHNLQSRSVCHCHMKGLHDLPSCVMKDPGSISGHCITSRIEQTLGQMPTRTTVDHIFPSTMVSKRQLFTSQSKSFPVQTSHVIKEDSGQCRRRTGTTLVLRRKSDLVRKSIAEQSQNMLTPDVRGLAPALAPTLALRYRPHIIESMNYSSTYLDHEIRILEKLRDILQTDSLADILECLSKATLREKEFISNFIRSDITIRDLLNYRKQYVRNENEEVHLNLQAILKASKAKGSTEEEKQLGTISQESTACVRTSPDIETEKLPARKEKIRIPTIDLLPIEHPPSRPEIQESRETGPAIQTSDHLLYKRFRAKQPHEISKYSKKL